MTWEIVRHRKKAICLSLRHQPPSSLPWFPLHSFPSTCEKAMPGSHQQQHGSWQTSSFPPHLHWYHVWAVTRSLLSHFSVTGYDYTGARASETLGLTHSFLGQHAPIVNSKEHAECNGEPAPARGKFVAPPKSALGPCSVQQQTIPSAGPISRILSLLGMLSFLQTFRNERAMKVSPCRSHHMKTFPWTLTCHHLQQPMKGREQTKAEVSSIFSHLF